MSYLAYYPENNRAKSNKLKEEIEVEFRKKDKKKHRQLRLKLNNLNKLGESYIFQKIEEERYCSHKNKEIVHLGDGLYELRVPKQSISGVFRVYFTILYNGRILILDAEYKTEKEPKRLKSAQRKLERLKGEGIYVKGQKKP